MFRLTQGHIIALPVRGYHPLRPCFPDRFRLSLMYHWPGPRSLATTNGVSVDVLSSRYLDVSVPWVRLKPPILFGSLIPSLDNWKSKAPILADESLRIPLSKVGFPIRISADQSSFAAPRGFSQRSTSFIASQRQGIHQMPFIHLIALIINAHSALGSTEPDPSCLGSHRRNTDLERPACKIEPTTPCGQAKG